MCNSQICYVVYSLTPTVHVLNSAIRALFPVSTGHNLLPIDNIASIQYIGYMPWTLIYLAEYESWRDDQDEELQDEAAAHLGVLEEIGPTLGRPLVDTLKDSSMKNLKELRFAYKGAPIRILFAFDPKQQGVIILGGDKSNDKRWYKKHIPIAETLYAEHLKKQKEEDEKRKQQEKDKKEKGR